MRYKCWRSRKDTHLHLMCAEGSEGFEALPVAIRNLGPWTGGPEGDVERLRLPYRAMLGEQGFVVIHAHVSKLDLEMPAGASVGPMQIADLASVAHACLILQSFASLAHTSSRLCTAAIPARYRSKLKPQTCRLLMPPSLDRERHPLSLTG